MVNYYHLLGCAYRSDIGKNIWNTIDFPKLNNKKQAKECKKLSEEQKELWLAKLNQDFQGINLNVCFVFVIIISGLVGEILG